MTNIYEKIKAKNGDKIVLFLILVLTLLAAKMLVSVRGGLRLTEPMRLESEGLSVSLPIGRGYQYTKQWKRLGPQSYLLYGRKQLASGQSSEAITWVYHLAGAGLNFHEYIANELEGYSALQQGSENYPIGQLEWVILQQDATSDIQADESTNIVSSYMFVGFYDVGNGKKLELRIEAFKTIDEILTFASSLAESISYAPDDLTERNGQQFVGYFKSAVDGLLANRAIGKKYFAIKDRADNAVGFYITKFAPGNNDFKLTSLNYLNSGNYEFSRNETFSLTKGLTNFSIKAKLSASTRSLTGFYETLCDDFGNVTLNNDRSNSTFEYKLTDKSLPENLMSEIVKAFANSSYDIAKIDIIDFQGRVVPTILTKESGSQGFVISTTSFDGDMAKQNIEKFYLDGNSNIIEIVSERIGLRVTESTQDEIKKYFPKRALWIEQF